jgi:hypothetical protein
VFPPYAVVVSVEGTRVNRGTNTRLNNEDMQVEMGSKGSIMQIFLFS